MSINTQNSKIIFGLKVKQLRAEKDLSSAALAAAADLSVSYLNEIEKGKKKPRSEKIQKLAAVLGCSYEELTSPELSGNLAAVGELLHSNFLNELPLDLFGIELNKVVEIIASSPIQVSAFISTLVELSRTFAFKEENFYFHALRAYQELHYNYFENLEEKIDTFVERFNIPTKRPVPTSLLRQLLMDQYGYSIIEVDFSNKPALKAMRSVFKPEQKKLFINKELNEQQKALQLGKEIAYNYLKLKERINTSSFLRVDNFKTVLHNYFAGYFAVGLLVNQTSMIKDLRAFFQQETWDGNFLTQLLDKYEVSPEVLFQRFNVLPSIFNIKKLFFLRMVNKEATNDYHIDKEMHLNRKHQPHANQLKEHYCRRWLSIKQLAALSNQAQVKKQPVVGIQRSKYLGTNDEYLCFTIARPSYFPHTQQVSVTIGLLVDEELKQIIQFLEDSSIPRIMVGVTCERCAKVDCQERVVEPIALLKKSEKKAIQEAIENLK